MNENKNVPKIIENSGLALHKTRNLLSITDKILASKTLAVVDDSWLDELIAWADTYKIPKNRIPRDKQAILEKRGMLSLSENELNEIPNSIGRLTHFIALSLSRNKLSNIPESIGNLTNLTILDLSYNQLTQIPESIGNLTNLEQLFLQGNKLTKLPASICELPNLQLLEVSGNPIKWLPPKLINLCAIGGFKPFI